MPGHDRAARLQGIVICGMDAIVIAMLDHQVLVYHRRPCEVPAAELLFQPLHHAIIFRSVDAQSAVKAGIVIADVPNLVAALWQALLNLIKAVLADFQFIVSSTTAQTTSPSPAMVT